MPREPSSIDFFRLTKLEPARLSWQGFAAEVGIST